MKFTWYCNLHSLLLIDMLLCCYIPIVERNSVSTGTVPGYSRIATQGIQVFILGLHLEIILALSTKSKVPSYKSDFPPVRQLPFAANHGRRSYEAKPVADLLQNWWFSRRHILRTSLSVTNFAQPDSQLSDLRLSKTDQKIEALSYRSIGRIMISPSFFR